MKQVGREADLKEEHFYNKDPSIQLSCDGKDFARLVDDEKPRLLLIDFSLSVTWTGFKESQIFNYSTLTRSSDSTLHMQLSFFNEQSKEKTYNCDQSIPFKLGVTAKAAGKSCREANQTMYEPKDLYFQTPYHNLFANKEPGPVHYSVAAHFFRSNSTVL